MTSEKNRLIKDICQKGVWSKPKFVEVKMVKMSLNCLGFFFTSPLEIQEKVFAGSMEIHTPLMAVVKSMEILKTTLI